MYKKVSDLRSGKLRAMRVTASGGLGKGDMNVSAWYKATGLTVGVSQRKGY